MVNSGWRRQEIIADVELMINSIKLQREKRFYKMKFWEKESLESDYSMRIEGKIRLESVAEHSWHVADIIILLEDRFDSLDFDYCLRLAILHDKMEIFTGDKSPLGRDGTGKNAHAFNESKQDDKKEKELLAVEAYIKKLNPKSQKRIYSLLLDIILEESNEAKFVKAIDKIQSLIFILIKKKGDIPNDYLKFMINYSGKALGKYPDIEEYYNELVFRIIKSVADYRKTSVDEIYKIIFFEQKSLF